MAFVIPTYFKAFDEYSSTVLRMNKVTNMFNNSVGKAGKQLLAYGEAALFIDGVLKTGKGIMDYETEIQNLSAVTGATGTQLDKFKDQIERVSHATQKSAVEVAQAFTNVDNNMPQYHQNAQALGDVTEASITLAKAGRMELGPAAESLTMSMNQFGHAAIQAKSDVDALASGAVAGSSKIAETSEALQVFGTVAANVAKVTYNESVALVELGSKFEKGSEAGTRFRNILLDMTNIKNSPVASDIAAMGVNLEVVSNTALTASQRLHEIAKIKENPLAMEKLFDKRNVAMAAGIFSQLDQYDKILGVVSKTGVAEDMAAKNTNTLAESVNQLGAAWITEVATSKQAGMGLSVLSGIMHFTTENMNAIVNALLLVGEGFLVFKTVQASLYGYRFAVGMATFYTRGFAAANVATEASLKGVATAAWIAEIGLMPLIGTLGLVSGAVLLVGNQMSYTSLKNKLMRHEIEMTKDGFEKLPKPIDDATRALKDYMEQYSQHYKDVEALKAENYIKENHPIKYMFSLDNILNNLSGGEYTNPAPLPDPNNFNHLDKIKAAQKVKEISGDIDGEISPAEHPAQQSTAAPTDETSMIFNFTIDKDGKVNGTKPNNYGGAIEVRTGQTGPNYKLS